MHLSLHAKAAYKDYLDNIIGFTSWRSVTAEDRIKRFCMKIVIEIGYFNGKNFLPTLCKERNKCLHLNKCQFIVIWKSESVSSLKTSEEVKTNFVLQAACLDPVFVNAR